MLYFSALPNLVLARAADLLDDRDGASFAKVVVSLSPVRRLAEERTTFPLASRVRTGRARADALGPTSPGARADAQLVAPPRRDVGKKAPQAFAPGLISLPWLRSIVTSAALPMRASAARELQRHAFEALCHSASDRGHTRVELAVRLVQMCLDALREPSSAPVRAF